MASLGLELKNVSISFGKHVLFQNVNLSIAAGESFVIVGPSGGGKSLILKLFAGLVTPQQGEVLVKGKNLKELDEEERQKIMLTMGMLFQKNALFDSLRVGENIAFPLAEVQHKSAQEIQQKIEYFLKEVGLSHTKDLFPVQMSGGMQKRLGIARALALDPEIILYDDPTAGLDPLTSRKIIDLIIRLQKEKNSTVVAITNDMMRAYQLADRIGVLVDGELLVTGNIEQTKNHQDPRVRQFIRGELEGPLTK